MAHITHIFVNLVASVHNAVRAWVGAWDPILLTILLVQSCSISLESANKLGASLPTIPLGLGLAGVVGFVMETIRIRWFGTYALLSWLAVAGKEFISGKCILLSITNYCVRLCRFWGATTDRRPRDRKNGRTTCWSSPSSWTRPWCLDPGCTGWTWLILD